MFSASLLKLADKSYVPYNASARLSDDRATFASPIYVSFGSISVDGDCRSFRFPPFCYVQTDRRKWPHWRHSGGLSEWPLPTQFANRSQWNRLKRVSCVGRIALAPLRSDPASKRTPDHTSVCSARSKASSTSMPRYRTGALELGVTQQLSRTAPVERSFVA
jgi:hypothetical protein